MVSWFYSEILGADIWTGVTITQQNGPNALKMVRAGRIQKKIRQRAYLMTYDTVCIFSGIVRVKKFFEHFEKILKKFEVEKMSTFIFIGDNWLRLARHYRSN